MTELTKRTINLINQGIVIILKNRKGDWYLHQHTNIAAGPDKAVWGKRHVALEMFNLKWAFTIAKLYDCKVYSYNPATGQESLER